MCLKGNTKRGKRVCAYPPSIVLLEISYVSFDDGFADCKFLLQGGKVGRLTRSSLTLPISSTTMSFNLPSSHAIHNRSRKNVRKYTLIIQKLQLPNHQQ